MTNLASTIVVPNDDLPPDQPIIETSSLTRFEGLVNLLLDPQKKYPTMAAITGPAGIGKTIAVMSYISKFNVQAHTGLPPAALITLRPKPTPKAIAAEIAKVLHEEAPRGTTGYEISGNLPEIIERNDLQLLFIDEADYLKEDGFDIIRSFFDATGCPVALVGLPKLLKIIKRHEKFDSRVGLQMNFEPLNDNEILETVLPSLVFAGWKFDPKIPEDRIMGKFLWDKVRPSLRRLRNVLQAASQNACLSRSSNISIEDIKEAMKWSGLRATGGEKKEESDAGDTEGRSHYEEESEKHHSAKDRKKDREDE